MDRFLAILNCDADLTGNAGSIAKSLSGLFKKSYVFSNQIVNIDGCEAVQIPAECDTEPKRRNYINKFFRNLGFGGYLHVISDLVEITGDAAAFLGDLEKMMEVFDYSVWLSTVTDGCNYVYNRYTPRMSMKLDRPDVQIKTGLECKINFTSHSNTQWIAYDFSKIDDDMLRFDEKFTISMYFIIEFLARRKARRGENVPYFMNQYLTPSSEVGVFRNLKTGKKDTPDHEIMKKEDAIFKSMDIKYAPDGNLDEVLACFWEKLKKYVGI